MASQLQNELLTATILLSVLLVSGLGMHLVRGLLKLRLELVQAFFAIDVFMLALAILTANRVITGETNVLAPQSQTVQHSIIVSQLLTVLVLVIACERLLRFLLHREIRDVRTLPLLGSLMFFFLIINIVTPLLGLYAEFQHNFLYGPIVALALYAMAQRDGFEPILRLVRNAYFLYLGGALVCLVIKPTMVADFTYVGGVIPGLTIRLYGFSTHPNSLAPYCLMLLCCLWLMPFANRRVNLIAWMVGIVALVLTQSKTTLFLGLAIFAIQWLMSRRDALSFAHVGQQRASSATMAMTAAAVMSLLAIGGLVSLLGGAVDTDRLRSAMASEGLLTLTGRTFIWQISLSDLWENPLFGYGADLWGVAYQQQKMLFVAHAHNQYVHTLGDSGFVGLFALLVYLATLAVFSWKVRRETRWLSVGLAVYIFLRGITEAPMIVDSMFGADFATHMLLLVLCVGGMRDGVRGTGLPMRWRIVASGGLPIGADRARAGA